MHYFEVITGTELYEVGKGVFDCKNKWGESVVLEELEKLLGCSPIEYQLEMNPYVLRLKRLPLHLKDQFRRGMRDCAYTARKSSGLNKRYLDIIKKYKLRTLTVVDFVNVLGMRISTLTPIRTDGDFRIFFALDLTDYPGPVDKVLDHLKSMESSVPVMESEYLRLRLEMVEYWEKRKTEATITQ